MAGENDLAKVLRQVQPVLHQAPYGFGLMQAGRSAPGAFAQIGEDKATTVIAPVAALADLSDA